MAGRFREADGLSADAAAVMTQSLAFARFYEAVRDAGAQPRLAANWLMGEVSRRLNAEGLAIEQAPLEARTLAQLIRRVADGSVSNAGARQLFDDLWARRSSDVDALIDERGLRQLDDADALQAIVDAVIQANPKLVLEVRAGKDKAFNALVGQVMKASQGKANPARAGELLRGRL
jgi:aspartyl-tRNA(Asn)/glutamyl-tRNA(Gln) amidotransferase subunit B